MTLSCGEVSLTPPSRPWDLREASALMYIIIQTRTRINLWDLTLSEGDGLQLHIIVPPRENTTVLIA